MAMAKLTPRPSFLGEAPRSARPPRAPADRAQGAPSACASARSTSGGDLREPDPALEERRDRDLVRRVESARVGAAVLARLARERQEREALQVRRLELEREPAAEIERGTGVAARSG